MSTDDLCNDSFWPDLCRVVVEMGGSKIIPGPDETRNAHFDKLEAQLRSMQGTSQSQKAQLVAESLRQIGEHAIAAQISQSLSHITAAEGQHQAGTHETAAQIGQSLPHINAAEQNTP